MKKINKMWCLNRDDYFHRIFRRTGDQFETENLYAALAFTKTRRVALDGGAHYGSWTRFMAKEFDTVHAFEPNTSVYNCLVRNVEEFDNVMLHREALGHKIGSVTVGTTSHRENSGCAAVKGDGETPMVTIDSLGLENLDFLKLDLEGYEAFAIEGALETIARCKPVILFEDKGHSDTYGIEEGKVHDMLLDAGALELAVLLKRDFVYGWKETSLHVPMKFKNK